MDHSQGIFMRSDHQGNRYRKRGLGARATVQRTIFLHAVAILAHHGLAFDFLTHCDLAHSDWSFGIEFTDSSLVDICFVQNKGHVY